MKENEKQIPVQEFVLDFEEEAAKSEGAMAARGELEQEEN